MRHDILEVSTFTERQKETSKNSNVVDSDSDSFEPQKGTQKPQGQITISYLSHLLYACKINSICKLELLV